MLYAPSNAAQVSCTQLPPSGFCIALLKDGTLRSWGENWDGFLGDGTVQSSVLPVSVKLPAGVRVRKVSTAGSCPVALAEDGRLYHWSLRSCRALADEGSSTPKAFASISSVDDFGVEPFGHRITVVRSDGSVWSWGGNESGTFGDGRTGTSTRTPVKAVGVNLN